MNLKLVVISEAKCDSRELLLSEGSYGVGRKHDNELRIQEYCISGYHAELNRTPDGDYEVVDLDSSNGTFLNGIRISSAEKIKAGDFLKFGILKVGVEEHQGEFSLQESDPNSEDAPLKIVSLKDRFSRARERKEDTSPVSTENIPDDSVSAKATTNLPKPVSAQTEPSDTVEDKIILLDPLGPPSENPLDDLNAQLSELTASRDAAEEETRRLREELSKAREEFDGDDSDNEKRLSFHITELESSLTAERLLHDNVRAKNEQFRSKIQFLSIDLDTALEEISRLKATNARQFTMPEDPGDQAVEAGRLREELAISHDDSAELRAELIELKSSLSERELELEEKSEDLAGAEKNTISDLRTQITELHSKLAEAELATEEFANEKSKFADSREEFQRKLENAEDAVQKSIEREVNLRQNNAKLIDKVMEAERNAADLTAKIKETKSSAAKHQKQITKLEKQLKDTESHSDTELQLKDGLEAAELSRLTAEAEVEQLKEKLKLLKEEAQTVTEQLDDSKEKRSELDSNLLAESELTAEQSATIEQLQEELNEATRQLGISEGELLEKHREEVDAIGTQLQSALSEGEHLKEELKDARLDLRSSQESSAKEQTDIDSKHRARLSKIEEELSQSSQRCEEFESSQEELRQTVSIRDEQIANLEASSEDLENRFETAIEEKQQLLSDLKLTREGLSEALHTTRLRLAEATREMESEILRRVKVEKQLRKADAAIRDLLDEAEALRTESDEALVLSPDETSLNRISELTEEMNDEQKAFEARLEALSPRKNGTAVKSKNIAGEEFYRQLIDKLDLIDALIEQYENKWRYSKIIKQLALLKRAFVELLEEHSVNQFNLKPGTPLCLDQSNRIDLVPLEDGTLPKLKPFGKSEVVETASPGYTFNDVIIKKAKVVVS